MHFFKTIISAFGISHLESHSVDALKFTFSDSRFLEGVRLRFRNFVVYRNKYLRDDRVEGIFASYVEYWSRYRI